MAARVDTLALKSDPTRGVRRSAPLNPFQQLRQLGDIHRNPLRALIAASFLNRRRSVFSGWECSAPAE
jgi:hypothetical protein